MKGSRKLGFSGGYNVPLAANPFSGEFRVLDCGDIPVTSYVTNLFSTSREICMVMLMGRE
jgi:agmatinase